MSQSSYLEDGQYEVRVASRFRMGKKIGQGSFGEIFLGLDLQTGKEVAVKFVFFYILLTSIGISKSKEALTNRRSKIIKRICW